MGERVEDIFQSFNLREEEIQNYEVGVDNSDKEAASRSYEVHSDHNESSDNQHDSQYTHSKWSHV